MYLAVALSRSSMSRDPFASGGPGARSGSVSLGPGARSRSVSRRRSARTVAESLRRARSASAANDAARASRASRSCTICSSKRRSASKNASAASRTSASAAAAAARAARLRVQRLAALASRRVKTRLVLPPLRLERLRVLGSLRGEPRVELRLLFPPLARARQVGLAALRFARRLGSARVQLQPRLALGEPQDRRRLRVALLGVRLRLAERLPLRLQAAVLAALRVREPRRLRRIRSRGVRVRSGSAVRGMNRRPVAPARIRRRPFPNRETSRGARRRKLSRNALDVVARLSRRRKTEGEAHAFVIDADGDRRRRRDRRRLERTRRVVLRDPSQDAAGSERPRAATPNESRRVTSVSISVSRESRAEKEGFSSGFTSSSLSPPSASRASMDPEGGRFVIPRCTFVRAAVAGDAGVSAPRRLRPERSRKARTSARCASRAAPTASSSNRMRPTAPRRSEASSIDVSETDFSIFPPVSSTPGSAGLFLNASSGKSTDAPARTKLKLRSPRSRAGGFLGGFIFQPRR